MSMHALRREGTPGPARWEPLSWGLLLLVAAAIRLWDLGVRAMTHDESLHAYYAFELFSRGVYRHDPTYHGPFLYHLNAVVYFLFGASDFTARVAPTLVGLALVAAVWLLRPYLGRAGAFVAAALVAVSPTLLFYSRHIRNDIYVACFTLLWVYGALRYVEDGRRRWLYLVTTSMGLAFITKEVSFIAGTVIGSFIALIAVWPAAGADAVRRRRAAGDLAVLMFTLVLPFASGFGYFVLGWNPLDAHAEPAVLARGALLVGSLFGLGVLIGILRFRAQPAGSPRPLSRRDWAKLMGLFWGLQIVFFTTFFTNVRGGLASGIVGSLGYWLTQHEVARANQPWFYYTMLGALYEFLPLAVGGVASAVILYRLRERHWDPVPADDLPTGPAASARWARRAWLLFAIWWAVGSWLVYTWAGEKMPWLFVHQVLPVCLLAGWGLAALLRSLRQEAEAGSALVVAGGSAGLIVLAASVLRSSPLAGRDLESASDAVGWWLRILLLSGLLTLVLDRGRRTGWRRGLRLAASGVVFVAALLTVRASLQVNFVNVDLATELMSYAQSSPDVTRTLRRIATLSERTVGPNALKVAYDDESAWPFAWYLRDYANALTWGTDPALAQSAPVILVGPKNRDALWPYVAQGYTRQRQILYWWPIQDYATVTAARLWTSLADATVRDYLWQVFFHRRFGVPLVEWPARREFDLYVRNDIGGRSAVVEWPTGGAAVVEELPWHPEEVLAGPFQGVPLSGPTSLAIADDGARLVADGGNHRVVVLERDGALRLVVGSGRCALLEPGQPGCVDPDGDGPRSTGDGQFHEPWGVAAGPGGEIFVADTWNGRIQVFDGRGTFRRTWGRFGQSSAAADPGEPRLYGPRGLAFDDEGHLIVTDTGNKRLMVFAVEGRLVRTIGAGGDVPQRFDEPTGLVRDPNHTLVVADMWNQRILRLDGGARELAAWPVPGWQSRDAADKPSVAVDGDGMVYASDPEAGRVLVFTPAGRPLASFRLPAAAGRPSRPTGVAVDLAARKVLVLDHAGGRLLVLPVYRSRR